MEKPCEVYLLNPLINEETRRLIIECGGLPQNPVTGCSDEGSQPSSDSRIFSVVAAIIISGLIVGMGYWMVRL